MTSGIGESITKVQFHALRDAVFEASPEAIPENATTANISIPFLDMGDSLQGVQPVLRHVSANWTNLSPDERLELSINEFTVSGDANPALHRFYNILTGRGKTAYGHADVSYGDRLDAVPREGEDSFTNWFSLDSLVGIRHRELDGHDMTQLTQEMQTMRNIVQTASRIKKG